MGCSYLDDTGLRFLKSSVSRSNGVFFSSSCLNTSGENPTLASAASASTEKGLKGDGQNLVHGTSQTRRRRESPLTILLKAPIKVQATNDGKDRT